jgi:hypothetical protein
MPWLGCWGAGVKLRDAYRHSFFAGATIEGAGVDLFREPSQGQVPGNYAQFARVHSCLGIVTLLRRSTCLGNLLRLSGGILLAKLGDYQLIGKTQLTR